MNNLLERAMGLNGYIEGLRNRMHQTPEIGMRLPKTQSLIMDELRDLGLSPRGCGDSGVTVLIEGARPGRTLLLRADMDALPVAEETGLPFAAGNGCMHACGHDCHVAMLLGAARLLMERRDEMRGNVKLLFQPGEEIMEGAAEMLRCGVLENPHVEAAMMLHIISGLDAPSGSCAVFGAGSCYASVDWFRIDIQGVGGHGAMPHRTVNPLGIASDIYRFIHGLVAEGIDPEDCAVLTVGELHGGHVANVIPDVATMAGTLRTFDAGVRARMKERLASGADLLAKAQGGSVTVTFGPSAPCVHSDAAMRAGAMDSVRGLLGEEKALDLDTAFGGAFKRVTSSEDFAYIAEKVPAAVLWLMAGTPAEGYVWPGHHPKTDFSPDVFYVGSAVLAQSALDWLRQNPA